MKDANEVLPVPDTQELRNVLKERISHAAYLLSEIETLEGDIKLISEEAESLKISKKLFMKLARAMHKKDSKAKLKEASEIEAVLEILYDI